MAADERVTQDLSTWVAQQNYVERLMDNSAFTTAHPDNTLVLAGPARYGGNANNTDFIDQLLPIGALMNFSVAANAQAQPLQAIGSGRSFFVRSKGNISFSFGRLFVNGRNLLRVLYTTAIQSGLRISSMDDPAMRNGNAEQFVVNFDSELFYIPFGIAVLFRDKSRRSVGAFYVELAMLNTYNLGIASGQPMMLENVNGVADRIIPIFPNTQEPLARDQDNAPSVADLNDVVGIADTTSGNASDYTPKLFGVDAR